MTRFLAGFGVCLLMIAAVLVAIAGPTAPWKLICALLFAGAMLVLSSYFTPEESNVKNENRKDT